MQKGLVFQNYSKDANDSIVAISDSDGTKDPDDQRSTTGAYMFLVGNLIS